MASCQNCKALMIALKSQAEELHQQIQHLEAANEFLMGSINQEQSRQSSKDFWKIKYQQQLEANYFQKSKMNARKISQTERVSYFSRRPQYVQQQSAEPILTARTAKKENISSRSMKKMSELMKALVLEKADCSRKSSKMKTRRHSKRQIVLRIVDDRLNRQF